MAQVSTFRAVLFDRDGTLIRDVPYNGDPARVEPMPTAVAAVKLVRRRGLRTGVVTNQSGLARGLLSSPEVARVNARVDTLFGPFDVWAVCGHGPDDGCECRKPAPGLILRASGLLGIECAAIVVVGDIGADVSAAHAAGAAAVLVPTPATRAEEVATAPIVARTLLEAVRTALGSEVAA